MKNYSGRGGSNHQKTLSGWAERVPEFHWRLHPNDVGGLETLRTFEEIELHRLAFVQRTIAILLNGGKMDEYIFASRALDKTVALGPVKPLYCTFFSHRNSFRLRAMELLRCLRHNFRFETLPWHRSRTERSFRFADSTRASVMGSRVQRRPCVMRHRAPEPTVDCPSIDCQTQETSTRSLERLCRMNWQRQKIIFRNLRSLQDIFFE